MLNFLQNGNVMLGPLIATFLLGFTTFLLLLVYSIKKQSYWKKIGIPYAKPFPFFGSIVENISKPLHETELDRYNRLGRVYGHYEANRPVLSVGEPELLRQIFVKDFHAFTGRRRIETGDTIAESMVSVLQGEDWKRVRTIITPTFTTGKLKRMIGIFKECAQTLIKNFQMCAEKGKPINAKDLYGAFTMDVIASSAFSTKIDSHNDPFNQFVLHAQQLFTRKISWRGVLFTLAPQIMKLFKIGIFNPSGMKFFTEVTLQIVEERKKSGQTRNDFLQLLIDTAKEMKDEGKLDENDKDALAENYGKEESDQIFKQDDYTKKSLSSNELIGNCVIFFLAGYDTTASTLSFASYSLAMNPDIQEKLIEELDDTLKKYDGSLTYEAIQDMKYLDNVISETIRLYPPAIRLERYADEDYPLGDTGLIIPKSMLITIPIYAIHRDPKLYPDPEKFDPDRFTPEERAKRDQYAYLPFGHGPRNCVGLRFALLEIKVCLAYVLSHFRIKRCPQTKVPIDFYIGQGILQPKDILLALEERKDTFKAL